jgi:uncharacterized membrane protein
MKKILLGLLLVIFLLIVGFFAPAVLKSELSHESRVTINKPPNEVWKKFTNSDNMGKWIQGFKSIELVSGEQDTVGSKYKITVEDDGQTFEAIETVKEFVENEKFAFRLEGDMLTDDIIVTFANKGLTTEMVQSETIVAKGILWKALFYWMQSTMSARSQSNLNNFKRFVEEG